MYATPPGQSTKAMNSPQAPSVKARDVDQSISKKDKKEKKEKKDKKDKNGKKEEKAEKAEKPKKVEKAKNHEQSKEKEKKSKAAQNAEALAMVPVPVKRMTSAEAAKTHEEPETKKRKPATSKADDDEFHKMLKDLADPEKDVPDDDQSEAHEEGSDHDDEETLVLGASEYGDAEHGDPDDLLTSSEDSDDDEDDEEANDDEDPDEEDDEDEEEGDEDEDEEDEEDEEKEAVVPKTKDNAKGKAITAAAAEGCEVAKRANSAFTLFTMTIH